MSYYLKTLIVFDTNSLRSAEEGEMAYRFFTFGKHYQIVEEFIVGNGLTEMVHLAVPQWAIEELKDQKKRSYDSDVAQFKKLAIRLSGLPHTGEISFPETEFDCTAYVEQKATEFLTTKQIQLLEIKEEIANNVLKSMMIRVMKDQGYKAPFSHSGKYKDAGFKDNLVWESLMNHAQVAEYDKVIFICKDGDFNRHCVDEFLAKWGKYIAIEKEEQNVIAELKKDYGNFIDNRKVYDFVDKDYFKDYLNDILKKLTYIQLEKELTIENYKVENYCSAVERTQDEEGGFESLRIVSNIIFHTTQNGEKTQISADAITFLTDFETFTIEETTFNPNVY